SATPAAGRVRDCVGGRGGPAEMPADELGRDVLARLAGQGQLKVVDRRGPVHGHGLNHPPIDPVDQVRRAADLDDVAADRGRDGAPVAVTADDVVAEVSKFDRAELAGQGVNEVADRARGSDRPAQVANNDFARPRGQIVGLQPGQVEWFHEPSCRGAAATPRMALSNNSWPCTNCNPTRRAHIGWPANSVNWSLTQSFCVVMTQASAGDSSVQRPRSSTSAREYAWWSAKVRNACTSAPSVVSVCRNASGFPRPQKAPTGRPRRAATLSLPCPPSSSNAAWIVRAIGMSVAIRRTSAATLSATPGRVASHRVRTTIPARRRFFRGSRNPPRGSRYPPAHGSVTSIKMM